LELKKIKERKDWVRERSEGKKNEKHEIFWPIRVWRLDYHLVRSFKPNLEISYEIDNYLGSNHEINARI